MIIFDNVSAGLMICEAAGSAFNPAVDRVIARTDNGVLVGGVVYQGYTGASIHGHFAGFSKGWINRDLLWVAFDYPFRQLGCGTMFAQVPETNTKSLELCAHLGFKEAAKIEGVFTDGACFVLAMEAKDCRWLNLKPRGFLQRKGPTHG